jgi:hypothetical protein
LTVVSRPVPTSWGSTLLALGAVAVACGQAASTAGSPDANPGTDAGANAQDSGGDVELADATTFDGPSCASTCGSFSSGSSSGPYVCNLAGACVQCVNDSTCASSYLGPSRPVCLPDETCGCSQDSQCAGHSPGARCVGALRACGCATSADCPDPRKPVCDTASSQCFECATGADCTDPDKRACGGHTCFACITSADCATNGEGPTCMGGYCECAGNADCAGRGEGPTCSPGISETHKACSCSSPADCAGSAEGHACVNQWMLVSGSAAGWLQCGCKTDADCPAGAACRTSGAPAYRCRPVLADGGASESGAPDAQLD